MGCIAVCLDGDTAVAEAPCSVGDSRLGVGGADASGRIIDASGMPGIELAGAMDAGDCIYAVDSCTMTRSALTCAGAVATAPVPALSSTGWLFAVTNLVGVAFVALRRRRS